MTRLSCIAVFAMLSSFGAGCGASYQEDTEATESSALTSSTAVQAIDRAFASLPARTTALAVDFAEDATSDEVRFISTYTEKRLATPLTALRSSEITSDLAVAFPNAPNEQRLKMRILIVQILMGDIAGALRHYAEIADRDMRTFTRIILQHLDAVRATRNQVLRAFAKSRPPHAYAGNDPQQAAKAQDKAARYTQFVAMSTQLMNEIQNTERELVDATQSTHRDLSQFWQSYANFRD